MRGHCYQTYLYVFCLGAAGYPLLEILWRGYTHASMALAGGLCACWVWYAHARPWPLWARCLAGAFGITAVEFCAGILLNRLLGLNVWDYSDHPFHLLGQVCPLYTGLWFLLCLALSPLCRALRLYFSRPRVYNQRERNLTQRSDP